MSGRRSNRGWHVVGAGFRFMPKGVMNKKRYWRIVGELEGKHKQYGTSLTNRKSWWIIEHLEGEIRNEKGKKNPDPELLAIYRYLLEGYQQRKTEEPGVGQWYGGAKPQLITAYGFRRRRRSRKRKSRRRRSRKRKSRRRRSRRRRSRKRKSKRRRRSRRRSRKRKSRRRRSRRRRSR